MVAAESNLSLIEQNNRFRAACIPDWTQQFMPKGKNPSTEAVRQSKPSGWIDNWEKSLVAGEIVRSSDLAKRGRGLWLMAGRIAEITAVTLLQRHLLLDTIQSGRYLSEGDFLEGESPDGERVHRAYTVDLLVLTAVGQSYRAASGWADAMVQTLLRERLDEGLPTLVCTPRRPERALQMNPVFLSEAFSVISYTGVNVEEKAPTR